MENDDRRGTLHFAAGTAASILFGLVIMFTLAACLSQLNAYVLGAAPG